MQPRLSLLGLYKFDNTILDPLIIPEGLSKDALTDLIISECAELNAVYPNPDLFKDMLGAFSIRRLPIWERLYKTTLLEYNPIENYNRVEETTEDRSGNDTYTPDLSTTETDKATAFNSNALTVTGERETSEGGFSTTEREEGLTRKSTISGNIGVTTSQQMLEQERAVSTFDIYRCILDDFRDDFCVQVY